MIATTILRYNFIVFFLCPHVILNVHVDYLVRIVVYLLDTLHMRMYEHVRLRTRMHASIEYIYIYFFNIRMVFPNSNWKKYESYLAADPKDPNSIGIYIYMYIFVYACMYVYICVRVYMGVYMCVCVTQ